MLTPEDTRCLTSGQKPSVSCVQGMAALVAATASVLLAFGAQAPMPRKWMSRCNWPSGALWVCPCPWGVQGVGSVIFSCPARLTQPMRPAQNIVNLCARASWSVFREGEFERFFNLVPWRLTPGIQLTSGSRQRSSQSRALADRVLPTGPERPKGSLVFSVVKLCSALAWALPQFAHVLLSRELLSAE